MIRKSIFWAHLVVGLSAGLVILVMCVTGVLLTYQRQITAWADGARVTRPEEGQSRLTVDALLVKLKDLDEQPPSSVTLSSDTAAAASFSYGREKILFLDPYTGKFKGEGSKKVRAFFQSMTDWHRWLAMSGDNRTLGKAITGACNLGFLFLVVSGFYLWWPRKWTAQSVRAVTRFDFSLKGKARDWNWHNAAGFWSAIPLIAVVSTAVFFSYPKATELLYRVTGNEPPGSAGGGKPPEGRGNSGSWDLPGLEPHFTSLKGEFPNWRTISLRLPSSPKSPLNFTVDEGTGARPDLKTQVTINQSTGETEKQETYASHNSARKIRLWVRWIHTGEAGGIIGQTIAGAASGAGALLVWTGFALAWRRLYKRKGSAE